MGPSSRPCAMGVRMTQNEQRFLFLDVDGVILDNALWEAESNRLVGAAFSELLGGDSSVWARNHHRLWMRVWNRGNAEYTEALGMRRLNLSRWWDRLHAEWVLQLCVEAGVEAPSTFEERVDVAERALTNVYLNTGAVFPGTGAAIRTLANDFEIHTASGNPSWVVESVLSAIGVRELIGKPFGSELVGYQKGHDTFHTRILEDVGALAENSIFVDDFDSVLFAARKIGAKTVKVGAAGSDPFDLTIGSLSELPGMISKIT